MSITRTNYQGQWFNYPQNNLQASINTPQNIQQSHHVVVQDINMIPQPLQDGRQTYQQFDQEDIMLKNSLINEDTCSKQFLLIFIYFATSVVLFLVASSKQTECDRLVKWSIILASYFCSLSVLKLIQVSWALAQGEMIEKYELEKAESLLRWSGIMEFGVLFFITIAISFNIVYTINHDSCQSLYRIAFFITIMCWLSIGALTIIFGVHYHRASRRQP